MLIFLRQPLQPLEHPVGHVHAGDFVFHVFGRLAGADRADAGQDGDLFVQAQVDHPFHELAKPVDVEDELRLDELRTRDDLLCQAQRPVVIRRCKRVFHRADEKVGVIFGISLPFSNTWLFRIMRAMRIRLSESMSYTGLHCG